MQEKHICGNMQISQSLRWQIKSKTVFGAIGNGNARRGISKLLIAGNCKYNSSGYAILKLTQVNSTVQYGIKSWRDQATRPSNTIPNNLRNIDSYHNVKHGLEELDLANLYFLISNLIFLLHKYYSSIILCSFHILSVIFSDV